MVELFHHHLKDALHARCATVNWVDHRVHIFTRDETGLLCLPTLLERTLQLYW
jgi:hypothetical protein